MKTQISNLHVLKEQIEKIVKQKAPTSNNLIKHFIIDSQFKESILHIKIECSFGKFEIHAKIDPLGRYPEIPPIFALQKSTQQN